MNAYGFILSLLAASWLAGGCTGGNDRPPDPASEAPATETSSAGAGGTTRDACGLLTAAEVATVHGEPVEARPEVEGPYRSSCAYGVHGSDWEVMWITVHWQGGREEWETQQAGRAIGVRVMSAEVEEVDGFTTPDPLAGIGDAAYYGGILPSLVFEGDVLLEFMMPLLRNDREHFPTLARKALSRL